LREDSPRTASSCEAAGVGFEPTEPFHRLGGFQDRTKTAYLQAVYVQFASEFASEESLRQGDDDE
jgi:hypothetical protein